MIRSQPVFIGPVCVGKTTVSTLVAEELGIRRVELDEVAMPYYGDCPSFDPNEYDRLFDDVGFVAAYRYWEPALAFAVERLVADHPDAVLDLGAGHTCFLDRAHFSTVQRALKPFVNVVLLLPEADLEASIKVIRERLLEDRDGTDWVYDGVDFVRHWVTSDQNARLATRVIFTADEEPADLARRVVELISRSD